MGEGWGEIEEERGEILRNGRACSWPARPPARHHSTAPPTTSIALTGLRPPPTLPRPSARPALTRPRRARAMLTVPVCRASYSIRRSSICPAAGAAGAPGQVCGRRSRACALRAFPVPSTWCSCGGFRRSAHPIRGAFRGTPELRFTRGTQPARLHYCDRIRDTANRAVRLSGRSRASEQKVGKRGQDTKPYSLQGTTPNTSECSVIAFEL